MGETQIGVDSGDYDVAIAALANLLLQGDECAVEAVMAALTPRLRSPLFEWRAGTQWSTPLRPLATLILRDLASLEIDDQARLTRWIDGPGRGVHLVSTTSTPLYSLVERGVFLESLYYRVNTLLVQVEAGNDPSSDRDG